MWITKIQTFVRGTGSQLEFMFDCSLNGPSNVLIISSSENAQIAEPPMELAGVVNAPYMTFVGFES